MLGTVATSLSVVGLNAVQGVLLARLLGPAGRGAYGTAVFYTQTLLYIGLFGSAFVLARRAAQSGSPLGLLRNAAVRYSLMTGSATAAIVCTLALLGLPVEKQYLLPLCCACALSLPLEHLRLMLLAIDQGSGGFTRYNAGQLVHALALPLLLACGWMSGLISLEWVVAATVVAPFLGLVTCGVLGRRPRLSWSPANPTMAVLAREGVPYFWSVVCDHLFNRLDVLLILWLATLSVQGNYAAAVPAAGLLCSATGALALFSFNAGARPGAAPSLRRVLGLAAGLVLWQATSAGLLAWVLAPLMTLVYGSRFESAIPLALALLPANALFGCTQVAEGYLRGRNRNSVSLWSRLLGAVVVAAATSWWWPIWQEMAVPPALAAGQGVVLVCVAGAMLFDVAERQRGAA